MAEFAARVLQERGVRVADWSTTQLTPDLIDAADLVLTAESEHRAAVVSLRPAAATRTFTLLQFARLAEASTPSPAAVSIDDLGHDLIVRARSVRGTVHPIPGRNELPDPMGMSIARFRGCAATIDRAINQIMRAAVDPLS